MYLVSIIILAYLIGCIPPSIWVGKMFYGIDQSCPRSLDEIGQKLEISRERARQIKEKGIKKLRVSARSKLLKSYLG